MAPYPLFRAAKRTKRRSIRETARLRDSKTDIQKDWERQKDRYIKKQIYRKTDIQKDRYTERQINRKTRKDRKTEIQKDRETYRHSIT
jgi:hypothetical protein